jgi:hypothetical protein
MTREGLICRDGSMSVLTGHQQIAALWSVWSGIQTATPKDVDYDSDSVTRRVRIVDIDETVAKLADASRWGEASVRLSLVEVQASEAGPHRPHMHQSRTR